MVKMIFAHIIDPLSDTFHFTRKYSFDGDVGHIEDEYPEDQEGGGK
jgi:hypothetical protein